MAMRGARFRPRKCWPMRWRDCRRQIHTSMHSLRRFRTWRVSRPQPPPRPTVTVRQDRSPAFPSRSKTLSMLPERCRRVAPSSIDRMSRKVIPARFGVCARRAQCSWARPTQPSSDSRRRLTIGLARNAATPGIRIARRAGRAAVPPLRLGRGSSRRRSEPMAEARSESQRHLPVSWASSRPSARVSMKTASLQ